MSKIYIPTHIEKYGIYDIVHNDNSELVIISAIGNRQFNIYYKSSINEVIKKFNAYSCPHRHTSLYILPNVEYIECNEFINLIIEGENINVKVNKYPSFNGEIIMSTLIKQEDDYIVQWIKYHQLLGFTRFIIYDNYKSDDNTLTRVLKNYISSGIVVLIYWPYPYNMNAQQTQQNHSIHTFKNCKYIGMFDIDEYINPQRSNFNTLDALKEINIDTILNNIIINNKINIDNIGSFRLLCKMFYNPNSLPTNNYEFLKIYNCGECLSSTYEKNLVIPKNVMTFSVHMITRGKQMYNVPTNIIFFNHYYFLNKTDRGKNSTAIIDDSINRITKFLNI